MNSFKKFWLDPRVAQNSQHKRHVTFLELFYDLAFVVFISRINHILINDWSVNGANSYVPAVIIAYISWMNGSVYYDIHANNDIRTRFYMFIQMFFIGLMARFTHHLLTDDYVYFVFVYGILQLILAKLWYSTGISDKNHRLISTPYSYTFFISSMIVIISMFVDENYRLLSLWLSIMLTGFAPYLSYLKKNSKNIKHELLKEYRISETLVERMGIFLIIILGESLVSLVSSLEKIHEFRFNEIEYYTIGFLFMVIGWSNYYEYSNNRDVVYDRKSTVFWYLGHMLLVVGYSLLGIALYYLGHILMFDEVISTFNYTLGMAVTFILLSSCIITISLEKNPRCEFGLKADSITRLLGISAITSIVFTTINLDTLYSISAQLIIFSMPIVCGFIYNIRLISKK